MLITRRLSLLVRMIKKDLFLSTAKVLGLSVGFLVFIAMMLFVKGQLSFDTFHSKGDRIYRVNLLASYEEAAGEEMAMSHYRMEPLLEANYPEIEKGVRFFDSTEGYCVFGDKKAYFESALFTDSTFFDLFDFDLVYGQKSTALLAPNSIIISEEISKQLFGDENPVGKRVGMRYGHWVVFRDSTDRNSTISGVIRMEEKSHMQFDILTSFATPSTLQDVNWSGPVVNTYVMLKEGASAAQLEEKLETFFPENHESLAKMYRPTLQKLSDVHLDSYHISWDPLNWKKFDRKYIRICMILAVLVLIIAAINFIQLTIGQLNDRLKSTAIRKVSGSSNLSILGQNYFETTAFCMAALVISFLGLALIHPFLLSEFGINVSMVEVFQGLTPWILLATCILTIGLAGLVPALILQSIPVNQIIAGANTLGGKNVLTKFLIVTQLALSIGLLSGGIIVYNQVDYLLQSNNSFDQEFILQIPLSEESKKKYPTIKQEMEQLSGVTSVTAASNKFGAFGGLDMKLKIDGEEKVLILTTLMVDPNFLKFYDIPVIEGRNFEEWGKNEFIVNQAWVDHFDWENPMEEQLGFAYGRPGKVVGVIDDFNYNSLHEEVEALCIWSTNFIRVMSVKINPSQMPDIFNELEEIWISQVSDSPFTYTFLDDDIVEIYKTEVIIGKVVKYLTIISILLTAIGIYALSLLISKRKTKEVSIKKVLGASVNGLFLSYSFGFYKLIAIATILITPILYGVMNNWLQNFAYTGSIPGTLIMLGLLTMVLVSTIAIVTNLSKLVRANPVTALRENG